MRLIAHRGHLDYDSALGKIIENPENKPEYIQIAIDAGFDVEIDVWYDEGHFFLGHDKPQYHIELKQLEKWAKKQFVYAHCKNSKAAVQVPFSYGIIPFAHSEDDYVILPDMHLWVHPKAINSLPMSIRNESIIVATTWQTDIKDYFGICSDVIGCYKERYKL